MDKSKIVLVGVGGYGDSYLTLYRDYPEIYEGIAKIVGIVDPFTDKAPKADWIKAHGIPVFDTLEEFYKENSADLAVISTPIPLHKPQCITALENGSNVLCEKPITATVEDALYLADTAKRVGRKLGVGFQWSFCEPMNRLKKDILAGKFGKAKELKSLICWKRNAEYYNSWKGNIKTDSGYYILDSVVTNATAHYLHNIFFVLGEAADTAAMPVSVTAEVYRSKDIDSFDTVIMTGNFKDGAKFWYGATHSNDKDDVTSFLYKFEKADIHFNTFKQDSHIYAKFTDGSVEDYGNPQAFEQLNHKFETMIKASMSDDVMIPCKIETVLPHLKVCNGLFSKVGISELPKDLRIEDNGIYITGMSEVMDCCFKAGILPSQNSVDWAAEPVTFSPDSITKFEGVKNR